MLEKRSNEQEHGYRKYVLFMLKRIVSLKSFHMD